MFGKLDLMLNTFLASYVANVVGNLTAGLVGIAALVATIWVVNYGVSVMRGDVSEPMEVFAWKSMKMGFIAVLALGASSYLSLVYGSFEAMQSGMASIFLSDNVDKVSSISSAFAIIDHVLEDMNARLGVIRANANVLTAWDLVLADVIFMAGTIVFAIVAVFVTFVSKIFLAFGATIGPIAILCLIFRPTSKYFDAWLSFMLSAVVMTWFAFFALGLTVYVQKEVIDFVESKGGFAVTGSVDGVSPLNAAAQYLVLCVLLAILLHQAPKLASSLTGGAAFSTGAQAAAQTIVRMSGSTPNTPPPSRDGGGGGNGGGPPSGGGNSADKAAGSYAYQRVASLMRRK